jgi:signal transduction histidine kinase
VAPWSDAGDSARLVGMHTEASPMTDETRPGYTRLWRGVPREIGYLALTAALVILGFLVIGVVSELISEAAGVGSLIVAALALLGALWFARVFGLLEITRLMWAGNEPIRPAVWRPTSTANRFLRVLEVARDPHAWLSMAFTVLVFPAVGFLVSALTFGVGLLGLLGVVGGIAAVFTPSWSVDQPTMQSLLDSHVGIGLGGVAVGVALLALLPWITHGCVWVQNSIARAMLGPFRAEELAADVEGLRVSRSAAVSAEGTALRRLERDIHDGPQQRLIRIQMDLAAAARASGVDADRSRDLIEAALQQSRDALEELRALSRGFAPPLLLDRGLAAALEAVVDRATIPTRFTDELPADIVIPVEIERNAYFIAAELLTNAGKHSGATRAELIVAADDDVLRVVISDDGHGGATIRPGHGLAGIDERLRGLDGRLTLRSPVGGPTHVSVVIPVVEATSAGSAAPAGEPPAPAAERHAFAPTLPYPTEELPRDPAS